ncbi:hypothetical protein BRARA_E02451 [Brassica rapa]|uniref:GRF-type domain-containing protein n=1 Tax=Brassica campestris TaxID=3711 RepID=A0A397ZCR8_BRACM|nr:uncharacterized protein At1g43920, Chloroplastic-like [Brassica napus]RID63442.1 hypothetical protein BRARA_E02451 [Brassica rapa]
MGDRGRGIPKICRCGEAVVMRTANTARNPGRLFHSCPHGREGDWFHTFKWTDVSVYEEMEDMIEKVETIEGDSMMFQKRLNKCENEIENLEMDTRVCEAVVEKEIQECKMQLRSLKNILRFVLVIILFFKFIF